MSGRLPVLNRHGVARRQLLWSSHAPLAPYAVGSVLALLLVLLGGSVDWVEVGPAFAIQALLGVLLAGGFARSFRDPGPLVGVGSIVAYLASVALLRDGVGPSAGMGPLALSAVAWASLRGRRRELAVAVAGVAVIYIAPALLIGAPRYPTGSWRAGVLFGVVSAMLGVAVIQLVNRVESLLGRLAELAGTDELTGLANRRTWEESLDHEQRLARRTGQPLAMVMLDLDRFKEYNDLHGHLAGDQRLRQVAAAWQGSLRETDVLARWGGDEFGVLLPSCDAAHGLALIERLRAACPDVPFSAGVAEWDCDSPVEAMIAAADDALFVAKHAKHDRMPSTSPEKSRTAGQRTRPRALAVQ